MTETYMYRWFAKRRRWRCPGQELRPWAGGSSRQQEEEATPSPWRSRGLARAESFLLRPWGEEWGRPIIALLNKRKVLYDVWVCVGISPVAFIALIYWSLGQAKRFNIVIWWEGQSCQLVVTGYIHSSQSLFFFLDFELIIRSRGWE
jgi:hypothetical protein